MGGEWTFEFDFVRKESLKVRKYQSLLKEIREEFESKFSEMNPNEGVAEWTTKESGAPPDNMFAKFTYKCTRPHVSQGEDDGTWYLLWNPKKANIQNKLHARCAPELFKELSNKIQKKLADSFPNNFKLKWAIGLSGYGEPPEMDGVREIGIGSMRNTSSGFGRGGAAGMDRALRQFALMLSLQDVSDDDDLCPHFFPWHMCYSCRGYY